jgi:hypothetical protein
MRDTKLPRSGAGLPRISWWRSDRSSIRSSSRASRSAGVTGEKKGSTPASSASSWSSLTQNEWNVRTFSSSYGASRRASSRSRMAAAAGSEKVSARMHSAGVPCSTSQANRSVRVRVLPVPAPATTSSLPPGWATTARWLAFRPSRRAGIRI